MRAFWYTIENMDSWAITDKEIVIIAEDKIAAKKMLKELGYVNVTAKELHEMKNGVHVIQNEITE